MTVSLKLFVNDVPIKTDYFVENFLDHTLSGMLEALEDTGDIKDLVLTIEGDNVAIKLNGAAVNINAFVNKIIRSTTIGMVSTLKGVSAVQKLKMTISK